MLQYQYKGWKSKKKMGLTLQYINPIEVLQYQYKGWTSRRYHIQIVGFTQHNWRLRDREREGGEGEGQREIEGHGLHLTLRHLRNLSAASTLTSRIIRQIIEYSFFLNQYTICYTQYNGAVMPV